MPLTLDRVINRHVKNKPSSNIFSRSRESLTNLSLIESQFHSQEDWNQVQL